MGRKRAVVTRGSERAVTGGTKATIDRGSVSVNLYSNESQIHYNAYRYHENSHNNYLLYRISDIMQQRCCEQVTNSIILNEQVSICQ
jgi:hypothetical protein